MTGTAGLINIISTLSANFNDLNGSMIQCETDNVRSDAIVVESRSKLAMFQ